MNYTELMKQLSENILTAVRSLIKTAPYDQTYKAKITEVVSATKVKIELNRQIHTATTSVSCDVGDIVVVCVPRNNWNELYVEQNKTRGRTFKDIFASKVSNVFGTLTSPTLIWRLGDTTGDNYNTVQLRESGSADGVMLSAVTYDIDGNKTFNTLVDKDGTFLPNLGIRKTGSQISTAVTSAWTNNASISLSSGIWIVEGEVSYTGIVSKGLTVKMLYGNIEVGRQSVMSPDTSTYTAHLTSVITIGATTTVYIQTCSTGITILSNAKMTATRLR